MSRIDDIKRQLESEGYIITYGKYMHFNMTPRIRSANNKKEGGVALAVDVIANGQFTLDYDCAYKCITADYIKEVVAKYEEAQEIGNAAEMQYFSSLGRLLILKDEKSPSGFNETFESALDLFASALKIQEEQDSENQL